MSAEVGDIENPHQVAEEPISEERDVRHSGERCGAGRKRKHATAQSKISCGRQSLFIPTSMKNGQKKEIAEGLRTTPNLHNFYCLTSKAKVEIKARGVLLCSQYLLVIVNCIKNSYANEV